MECETNKCQNVNVKCYKYFKLMNQIPSKDIYTVNFVKLIRVLTKF